MADQATINSDASRAEPAPALDLRALKTRQHATWSSGDFAVIGTTLQHVGESLCEAIDLHSNERVLDVAAGNGNATLAAARRFAEVTSTDYVPALLDRSRMRAEAEGLPVAYQVADAEELPFADGSFDVVLSTFGVMFTADHRRAAREMLRVCRPGGRIGMANWTPAGMIGELFKVIGRHVPPPAGAPSPAIWGTQDGLQRLFGEGAASIAATPRDFMFRYRSPQHWVDTFRQWYGPVLKAFATLDQKGQKALEADLLHLLARFNRAEDGTLAAPGEYLEVVVTTRT
jgi:ubiquinone/menaquinone biosynthesis C-methylase UbiE